MFKFRKTVTPVAPIVRQPLFTQTPTLMVEEMFANRPMPEIYILMDSYLKTRGA